MGGHDACKLLFSAQFRFHFHHAALCLPAGNCFHRELVAALKQLLWFFKRKLPLFASRCVGALHVYD